MRKGIEFSFAWLFSIVAGAVIIFLAIYAGAKMISSSQYQASTATAKELSIIFEPLETGLASGMSTQAILSGETRIYNDCMLTGIFGKQEISLATKSGRSWSAPGGKIPIENKYLFSENIVEGKKIYFFSMPFEFPFKVADTIVMSAKEYCLLNAPSFIEEDLENLNLGNVKFNENCSKDSVQVCFGSGTRCNTTVFSVDGYETGYVTKGASKMYFTKNLVYPAIFSDASIYECNVKRLMKKASQLALVYRDESNLLSIKCSVVPGASLNDFAIQAAKVNSSSQIAMLAGSANIIDSDNNFAECRLW